MRSLALLLAAVLTATFASPAAAGPFARWFAPRPSRPAPESYNRGGSAYYGSSAYRGPSAAELYPKFYGGFHSREFQRIGVPSGDIGPRGNGIYWTPW